MGNISLHKGVGILVAIKQEGQNQEDSGIYHEALLFFIELTICIQPLPDTNI